MRLWYLSHRRPAKARAFAVNRHEVWKKTKAPAKNLAPLDGCACTFEERVYRGQKVAWSHELAQFSFKAVFYSAPKTSAVSSVNPDVSQWKVTLCNDARFLTVNQRIYFCNFLHYQIRHRVVFPSALESCYIPSALESVFVNKPS